MRKSGIVLTALLLMSIVSFSQVRFGIHGNAIGASGKLTGEEDGDLVTMKLKTRFSWKAGLVAEISIAENFVFRPELSILNKGGKLSHQFDMSYEGQEYRIKTEGKLNLLYVELPFNFAYKIDGFFIGAGPSLSYGLTGKHEMTQTYTSNGEVLESETMKGDVKFDGDGDDISDDTHLKALELGANFITGYEFANGLSIRANFNLGLSNISPVEGNTFKNNYFSLGIGYLFGSRK